MEGKLVITCDGKSTEVAYTVNGSIDDHLQVITNALVAALRTAVGIVEKINEEPFDDRTLEAFLNTFSKTGLSMYLLNKKLVENADASKFMEGLMKLANSEQFREMMSKKPE